MRPETQETVLSRWQSDVFLAADTVRFRNMIAGRRAGKTHLMKVELIRAAIDRSSQNVGYWAPTWSMAKDLMWEPLKTYLPAPYLRKRPSESELMLDLINGSKIVLRSADNPSRSRGWGWNFVAFDEYAFMDRFKELWGQVVRPGLSDRVGSALFGTTPFGLNHAYDFHIRGLNPAEADWQSWQVTSAQGGRIPAAEIAEARRSLDPRTFRQEYGASFEALGGRVYETFDPAQHVQPWVRDNGGELLVGMDFNVNPMSLVLGTKAGDQLHIFDALSIPSSNTSEACAELRRRYPERAIIVCPDPSGRARRTSAVGGQTDFTIIESYRMLVDAPNAAPSIADRLTALKTLFRTAAGTTHCYIHPRATSLIRALVGQVYKEGTSIPVKDGFDHPNDALGYLVWQRFNRLRGTWRQVRVTY